MSFWGRAERVAIGIGPDRLRVLVARGNGTLEVRYTGTADLSEGVVRRGLRAPAFEDPAAADAALGSLLEEARAAGGLRRRPELVTVLAADSAVKMGIAPVEGASPSREEGERIARWVLRDLLPLQAEEMRADWSVVRSPDSDGSGRSCLLSLGAEAALVRDLEAFVARTGLRVGRVVPWTLSAAAAAPQGVDRCLVLCDGDGSLGAMFQVDGVPRLHRAWRARVPLDRLGNELVALQRYVNDHLEAVVGRVLLCGTADWSREAAAVCGGVGLDASPLEPDAAMLGAMRT